ncbi:MAG: hypothetical protein JWM11_4596, partial [Planctomycetaceae bacterium]|nr:hypothetical protein [Planctomycetaceae bacterium]
MRKTVSCNRLRRAVNNECDSNNKVNWEMIINGQLWTTTMQGPCWNLTRIFNHGFTTRKAGHGFGMHCGALAA